MVSASKPAAEAKVAQATEKATVPSRKSKVAKLLAPLKKRRAEANEKSIVLQVDGPKKKTLARVSTGEFEKTQDALLKALKVAKKVAPIVVETAKENIKERQKAQSLKLAKAMIDESEKTHHRVGPAALYGATKKSNIVTPKVTPKKTLKKSIPVVVVKKEDPKKDTKSIANAMAEAFPEAPTQKHVVAKGDTMWAIARRYGVKVKDIKELNPQLNNVDSLKIGHELTIPYDTLAAATMTPSE